MSQEHFHKIRQFYFQKRRMPSYSEMARLFGYRSKNSAYKIVNHLIRQGALERDPKGKILPTRPFLALPVLGTIEAGFPSPAEEELLDTMTLEEYLIGNKDATYILRVRGDSMVDAGIMPGDMALVERGKEPQDGDIVIAEVDHQWTMKFFRKKGRRIFLQAGNKKYKSIYPREELRIAAVVKSIIRKY